MSTLAVPHSVPSVGEDVEQLHSAFKGMGTDEGLIVSILAHRNADQRKAIREAYASTRGEDLLKAMEKELTSDFERVMLLWTLDPSERDAMLTNGATKRWTSSNQVLMEVACTRTSYQLLAAKQAYHTLYKKSLEEDVGYHTTGDFRKLLLPLVSVFRYDGDEVNMTLAKSEAKILHEKIKDNKYNDDEVIRILTTRSKAQILATLNHYKDEFENDIEKDLEADSKDEYLSLLRGTINCLTYPERYFAEVLRLAITGHGTEEHELIRIVTTRAEVDLKVIKEEYYRRNSIHLDKAIRNDTGGEFEKMLLALIGHGEEA